MSLNKQSTRSGQSSQSVRWMTIPYFPISVKYLVLMAIVFIVSVTGTGVSRFEAFALSFVTYSVGLLLDRVETMGQLLKGLTVSAN